MTKGNKGKAPSSLVAAAIAFDEELRRYAHTISEAQRRTIDSRKALDKVAQIIRDAADSNEQLMRRAQALIAAVNDAREQQEAQQRALLARAEDVKERTERFVALMGRYQEVEAEVKALLQLASQLLSALSPLLALSLEQRLHKAGEAARPLGELDARLEKVIGSAQQIAAEAREANFQDVAREAHALHQSISSTRHKIAQAREALLSA